MPSISVPVAEMERRNHRRREQKSIPVDRNPSPSPQWIDLPLEITANILHRLGPVKILDTAVKVCTTWRSVCSDPSLWRVIDMWSFEHRYMTRWDRFLEQMCRQAVDRSQGQLVEINVGCFGSFQLFDYIAERSKLKILRLECFVKVCKGEIYEVITKFPLLEELELKIIIANEDLGMGVEVASQSCPLLRSLALNNVDQYDYGYRYENQEAFAIARNMPNLRHLQLRGMALTNEGLEAILDGCPHLESLDFTLWDDHQLKEDLRKRLLAQIKCLTL